jgi:xanthine dehydrogenase D subunit
VSTCGGVGDRAPRIDAVPKVTGAFRYGSDLRCDGMLWGATCRSPLPYARVTAVDASAAATIPGVAAVLTFADVPGINRVGLNVDDQPVLAEDVVRYAGEPVALVAADSPRTARRAAAAISVALEPLTPLLDMAAALSPDAPVLHPWGNVLRHVHLRRGDPDNADADVWVDGYYETAMQDQAPLGPEAGLAVPAADGGVDLYAVSQWLHVDREQIAPSLGLADEKVRLHLAGVGGAFGSREDLHMQVHACLLALRTGRPVKMSYGREESFQGHVHRHPSRMWMRHGATHDGRLVAVTARLLLDGGAYASSSPAVVGNAATFAAGPYDVPNVAVEGTVVYTNNPPCGAMRGFGAPQVCFAHEAQMDKLAHRLGIDPVELRLRNAMHRGSVTPNGQVVRSAPVREVIERCAAVPLPPATPAPPGTRRGVGIAVGHKNIGFSEGFDDAATARVTLARDGAEVHTAAVEMGQGLYTFLTQVVRTELGVEHVTMHPTDTSVGDAGSTSASRQSMMAGGAVQLACQQVRDELYARAAARAGVPCCELMLEDGWVTADGLPVARVRDLLDEPIARTAVYHHRRTAPLDDEGQGDAHVCFAFAAERVVVEVDEELGTARVTQVAAAIDVGRLLNPIGFEGQVAGGTAQGLGLALMEEVQLRDGVIANPSFTDYLLPTVLDMPQVVAVAVEDPEPGTPYGLKGIGETPTVVATAAVVAALRDATGRELNRAPVSPDELVGLRGPASGGEPPGAPDVPGQAAVPLYFGTASGQQHLMVPSA